MKNAANSCCRGGLIIQVAPVSIWSELRCRGSIDPMGCCTTHGTPLRYESLSLHALRIDIELACSSVRPTASRVYVCVCACEYARACYNRHTHTCVTAFPFTCQQHERCFFCVKVNRIFRFLSEEQRPTRTIFFSEKITGWFFPH